MYIMHTQYTRKT